METEMNNDKFVRFASSRGATRALLDLTLVVMLIFGVFPVLKHYDSALFPARSITVSGEGKVTVSPDIAETSFSVVSRGQNPETLADGNNKKVNAAIDFLKTQGIEAKDIKTTGYNLQTDYDYTEAGRIIRGYVLTQTVSVKIRNFDTVATVIGGLTPLGVNEVYGITFSVDDPEAYLADARTEAFEKAKHKAEAMALQNGLRLGRVVNVSEGGGGMPVPYYYDKGMGVAESLPMAVTPPRIEPGSQEVQVTVTISYELR